MIRSNKFPFKKNLTFYKVADEKFAVFKKISIKSRTLLYTVNISNGKTQSTYMYTYMYISSISKIRNKITYKKYTNVHLNRTKVQKMF